MTVARYVEFKIPTGDVRKKSKKIENPIFRTAYGELIVMPVNGKRIKFVVQTKIEDEECCTQLVHYASGYVISRDLQAIRIQAMAQGSQYHRMTNRQAAKAALHNRTYSYGEKYVLDALNSVPVINV